MAGPDVFAAFNALVHQRGAQRVRQDLLGDLPLHVVALTHHAQAVFELLLPGGKHLLEVLEPGEVPGWDARQLAVFHVDAIVAEQVEDDGHDGHGHRAGAALARQVGVQTAGDGVIPGVLQRHAVHGEETDIAFVADKGGMLSPSA